MGAVPGTIVQDSFRGYNDGTEAGSVAIAAENANFSQALDTVFQMRFHLHEITNGVDAIGWQLQYNLASAGWNDVNASSLVVRSAASAFLTEDEDTTERLTSTGAYAADNDGVDEVSGLTGIKTGGYWALKNWEVLYSIQIRSADVTVGQTLQLRVVKQGGTALSVYTNTPTITAAAASSSGVGGHKQLNIGIGISI